MLHIAEDGKRDHLDNINNNRNTDCIIENIIFTRYNIGLPLLRVKPFHEGGVSL